MTSSTTRLIQRQWQRAGWLSNLLLPLAGLAWLAITAKRTAYRRGWRQAYRPPVPVIVVGNIYVGGTGKTPVVVALVKALRERGYTPGVVSRGYGVKVGQHAHVGRGDLSADRFGDEPALIARATGAPISVHPDRPRAARTLLSAHPEVDVIISDDGLQHLALARDVEIVVQDDRGVGNGRLLPAGPLREPPGRLADVDVIIDNVADAEAPGAATAPRQKPRRIHMWMELTEAWRLRDGQRRTLWELRDDFAHDRIAAAAGIGNPQRFFASLRASGMPLAATVPLPDHYSYTRSPFRQVPADLILVTTKDAVKCLGLGDNRLWVVPAVPRFSDPHFFDWLAGVLHSTTPPAQPANLH
ncbi:MULTISPECIES: tetraacyldisaccharide 4'-kinase [unclassified Achromobacter]|uniref:tetraacyldisaccharide 4'-kinase n=1 Tax=unclassified Achromobacter TaxID=2626865 RepID=UPI000B51A983|nr:MULTISPECIES: tetraacyldisaccharide 4'-kinase [unclassified Achromobacter]OWT80972.1 tetraacyldisaccharide 4'-kinase [Achromobacter sp. HZ34]OWT81488.1 tetraacyldisaccharide 4'-kinase [Achromobacter sp. HZ28]